jgi:hypothetical protein
MSGKQLIGGSGSQGWSYHGIELVTIAWKANVEGPTCNVQFTLEGQVLDSCQLGINGSPDTYNFDMTNSEYFAAGSVTLTVDQISGDAYLQAGFKYGELSEEFNGFLSTWQIQN